MRSMPSSKSSQHGVTLIEIMIVIAILGIIAAMAATSAQRMGARNATQNAASEIGSLLQQLRVRAEQRGSTIYVMVYPTYRKTSASLTGGNGALFIYEDGNGDFLTSAGDCDGTGTADCGWTNFNPVTGDTTPRTGSSDVLVKTIYLDDFPRKNVKFGRATTSGAWPKPFSGITDASMASGCSFCNSGVGALVISPEQELYFLKDDHTPVAGRVAGLSLTPVNSPADPTNSFRYGFVGATGLITLAK